MRSYVMVMAALGLAACGTAVPDSGAGVGFTDYNTYNQQQTTPAPAAGFSPGAALAAIDKAEGRGAADGMTPSNMPLSAIPVQPLDGQPIQGSVIGSGAVINSGATVGERPRGNAPAGIAETTSEMANVPGSAANVGISDEQDFQAVKARETIESDKERIARNRSQYQVDQPTALPTRAGDAGPNIVAFAISTNHPIGTQMYKRSRLSLNSYNAACARFASPDLAQTAFLAAGGPNKDRKGVDPDGDGYACAWDPTPFRTAVQN
jgi:hypothetical protein